MTGIHGVATAVLRRLDPETSHGLALAALRAGLGPRVRADGHPVLATRLAGVDLPNPIGLAAGFDKDARVFGAMLRAGFGFVECGTTTPLPQAGNPRPRIFRLDEDQAIINRLGFNNAGMENFAARLAGRRGVGVVGANIGANRDSADRIGDYVRVFERLRGLCDYFTINVSSPNTAGLRELQTAGALDELLSRIQEVRGRETAGVPIFLKIAPDLREREIADIVEAAVRFAIDGLVVSNTTVRRPEELRSSRRTEAGGLSGAPLMDVSTEILRLAWRASAGRLALIGVGGVASGADAYAKIRAGASAVQLYSALVFQGPGLVPWMLDDLAARLKADGFPCLEDAIGAA